MVSKKKDTGAAPKVVKLAEVVEAARLHNPKPFGEMKDKRAELVVNAVMQQLLAQLNSTQKGVVRVPRFGAFAVNEVMKKDGTSARRVVFRPAGVKSKVDAG